MYRLSSDKEDYQQLKARKLEKLAGKNNKNLTAEEQKIITCDVIIAKVNRVIILDDPEKYKYPQVIHKGDMKYKDIYGDGRRYNDYNTLLASSDTDMFFLTREEHDEIAGRYAICKKDGYDLYIKGKKIPISENDPRSWIISTLKEDNENERIDLTIEQTDLLINPKVGQRIFIRGKSMYITAVKAENTDDFGYDISNVALIEKDQEPKKRHFWQRHK